MNGYASNIRVTLHADGSSITIEDDGRGIPVDKHPTTQEERARGDLHGAPRRRQVRARQLQDRRRPARRRRERRQRAVEGARRHRQARRRAVGDALQAGQAGRPAEEDRPGARHAARRSTSTPTPRSSRRSSSTPAIIRERLEVASYLHKGVKVIFEDEAAKDKIVFEHSEGHRRLPEEDRRRARRQAGARRAVHADQGRGAAARPRAAVDRSHRRARRGRTSTASRPARAARTRTACAPGIGKAVRNFIDTHNLSPKGVTLTAEDIREGLTGVLSVFIQEPQFQGQTKDRLNNPELRLGGGRRGAARRSSTG